MTKPSDHWEKGTLCQVCKRVPATCLTRLVTRDDDMMRDALIWATPTCFRCAERLKLPLDVATGKFS